MPSRFLAAVLLLVAPFAAAEPASVVVLPLSKVAAGPTGTLEAAMRRTLEARGWTVIQGDPVERFLEERRIRYLDSLSAEDFDAVRREMNATAVVTGSVLAWREGTNPLIAVAARMLDAEGEVIWGDVVAASSAEWEGALGFGRHATAESLAGEVAVRLLERIPRPGEARRPSLNAGRFASGPATYRSASHPRGQTRRVCILPFASTIADAGRISMEILTVRLEATGDFDVVEPAELRAAMRAAKLRSIAAMTSSELAELGKHLGTTLFLRGNVHALREASGGRSEIQFDMTLSDVASGEIVWAVTHQRRGGDYAKLFQRGTIENVVTLADRAISEAISEQHRARPRGPRDRSGKQARNER